MALLWTEFQSPNCLPNRTYGAGRPHVWLCPKFLVHVFGFDRIRCDVFSQILCHSATCWFCSVTAISAVLYDKSTVSDWYVHHKLFVFSRGFEVVLFFHWTLQYLYITFLLAFMHNFSSPEFRAVDVGWVFVQVKTKRAYRAQTRDEKEKETEEKVKRGGRKEEVREICFKGSGRIHAPLERPPSSRSCLSGTLALCIDCQSRQTEPIYPRCRHYRSIYQSDAAAQLYCSLLFDW